MTSTRTFTTLFGVLSVAALGACDKRDKQTTEVPGATATTSTPSGDGECLHSEGCCGGHTEGDGSCGAAKAGAVSDSDVASATSEAQRFEWTVEPGKFAEINVELAKGTEMTASFEADGPLAWNVHSHPGDKPTIHAEGTDAKAKPAFTAEAGGPYSYLWANKGSKPVKLVVELRFAGGGKVHSTHP